MSASEYDRLVDEGKALLDELDAFNEREEKERTMGSMASSSYRSDMFRRAVDKFREAIAIEELLLDT